MRVKFSVRKQRERLTLTRQISSECVHCVGFWWPKPQFWANLDFWGLLYRCPCTDECQIWCAIADPQCTFTCQNSFQSVYCIALWKRKTPIFANFCTSAFSDVDSWRQFEKVEHGCTTTNLPLSNVIKIISVFQRLRDEIGRTNSDVQKRGVTKCVTDKKA